MLVRNHSSVEGHEVHLAAAGRSDRSKEYLKMENIQLTNTQALSSCILGMASLINELLDQIQ